RIRSKTFADMKIAMDIIAGPPRQLVNRLDVLHEVTAASMVATRVAAGAPHSKTARKTKTSPGVIDVWGPGIWIGRSPATNPTAIKAPNSSNSILPSRSTFTAV